MPPIQALCTVLLPLLLAVGCGSSKTTCVTGQASACACVDGKMGAQTCQADGTFSACQCGISLCNSGNCVGCCDATGTCQSGNSGSACGSGAQLCVSCGLAQACTGGNCVSAGGTGGGSGGACGPNTCTGCCDGSGLCQSLTGTSPFCGLSGGACSTCAANQLCESSGTCTTVKRIFTTKTLYTGNLGGIVGADQKCSTAALAAGLTGTWKAWISDGTTDAISRIADVGPWYLVRQFKDKTKVFNNKVNLMTTPATAISVNEDGQAISRSVWTGTVVGGTKSSAHCAGWTLSAGDNGELGSSSSTSNTWTQATTIATCAAQAALFCIEQ